MLFGSVSQSRYEGSVQRICANGHYSHEDAYFESDVCKCGAKIVWSNGVDDTNGESVGHIDMEQFVIEHAKYETCDKCGSICKVAEGLYRVPTEEETKAAQTYWCEEKSEFRPMTEYPTDNVVSFEEYEKME